MRTEKGMKLMKTWSVATAGMLVAALSACGAEAPIDTVEDVGDVQLAVGGLASAMNFVSGPLSAVGLVLSPWHGFPGGCSGTLVARDRFLFAAHCLCSNAENPSSCQDGVRVEISFPQDGHTSKFHGTAFASRFYNTSGDWPTAHDVTAPDADDFAVAVLDTPVPISLVDTIAEVELGSVMRTVGLDHTYPSPHMVGFGEWRNDNPGVGILCTGLGAGEAFEITGNPPDGQRRVAGGIFPTFKVDPNDQIIPGTEFLYNDAPWLESQHGENFIMHGDSGGPLFSADNKVVGVASGMKCDPSVAGQGEVSVWAAPGHDFSSSQWVGQSIGRPTDMPFDQTALYGWNSVKLNDRSVVSQPPGTPPAIVAGALVETHEDVTVPRIVAGSILPFGVDRLTVTNGMKTFDQAFSGPHIQGPLESFVYVGLQSFAVADFSAQAFPIPNTFNCDVSNPGRPPDVMVEPGHTVRFDFGTIRCFVTVKQNGTLRLGANALASIKGNYRFASLFIEPGGTVIAETSSTEPVRIFTKAFNHKGNLVDADTTTLGDILVAVVGVPYTFVNVENRFNGTLIVPEGKINLQIAQHEGQFIARDIELHQALSVRRRAFPYPWCPAEIPACR